MSRSTDMFPEGFHAYMREARQREEQGLRDGYHDAAIHFGGPLVETVKLHESEEAFMPTLDLDWHYEEGFLP